MAHERIKDNVGELGSGVRGQLVLKIFGADLDVMKKTLESAIDALKTVPGIIDLDLYRETTVPQLQVEFDRSALAREGVSMETAQNTFETTLAGTVATSLWEGERQVPVRLRLPRSEKIDSERIAALQISTPEGNRVALR